VAGILVAEANGYAIDFHTLTVQKFGLLAANVTPPAATVMLTDGKLAKTGSQYAGQLPPGTYTLSVSLDAYHPWQRSVRIEAGKSTAFPLLTLFRVAPERIEERPATAAELATPLIDPSLTVVGGEIWRAQRSGQQLVTRLSRPISAAVLLDQSHVALLVDSQVRVIDVDGSNDQVLLRDIPAGTRLAPQGYDQIDLVGLDGQLQRYVIR